jgi:hypothetical protein
MTRAIGAGLALLLALSAAAQDKGDKIGKATAPAAAAKFLAEVQKRKSCAITENFEVLRENANNNQPTSFEGVLRKDIAGVKGAAEVYAKGSTYLVNTGARFDPPEEMQGREAVTAQAFKNPSLLFAELARIVKSATFGGDEVVDGKDCRIVDFVADAALLREHMKELGDRLGRNMRGFGGGGFGTVFNPANSIDEKNSVATYRVSVGKEDLNVYRIEFVMRPKLKPNSVPREVPMQNLVFDQKLDVKFSKWDEEVAFEFPVYIKNKWGVK